MPFVSPSFSVAAALEQSTIQVNPVPEPGGTTLAEYAEPLGVPPDDSQTNVAATGSGTGSA